MRRSVSFAFGLALAAATGAAAQSGPGGPPSQPPGQEQQRARLGEANDALLALQARTREMLQLALELGEPVALDRALERLQLELQWMEERHNRLRESFGAGHDAGLEVRLREMDGVRARLLIRLQAMECDLCEPALERLRLQLQLCEEQHLRLGEAAAGTIPGETLERLREAHQLRAQARLQLREMECQLFQASLDPSRLAERLREIEQLQLQLAEQYRALGQQLGAGSAGTP